jgi:hypothetical protein
MRRGDHCAEVVFPQSVTWKVPVKDDHLEELGLRARSFAFFVGRIKRSDGERPKKLLPEWFFLRGVRRSAR